MKTEIDIRKTVKCILEVSEENICREVTVGQLYKVQGEDDEHYYVIDNTGKPRYYEKQYFEISQPIPKDESKEGEIDVAKINEIAIKHQKQMCSVHPHAIIGTIEDAIIEFAKTQSPTEPKEKESKEGGYRLAIKQEMQNKNIDKYWKCSQEHFTKEGCEIFNPMDSEYSLRCIGCNEVLGGVAEYVTQSPTEPNQSESKDSSKTTIWDDVMTYIPPPKKDLQVQSESTNEVRGDEDAFWRFEKEFRTDNPQTIGESDKHFDLDNYKDWLDNKLAESRAEHAHAQSKIATLQKEKEELVEVLNKASKLGIGDFTEVQIILLDALSKHSKTN